MFPRQKLQKTSVPESETALRARMPFAAGLEKTADEQEAERPLAQAMVEDYLDRVCLPLVETLPYAARTEMRREVAAHLQAIASAYEEMGDRPAQAAQKALAKFGGPEKVARLWRQSAALGDGASHRGRGTMRWVRRQWPGISVALSALFLLVGWFSPLHPLSPVSSAQGGTKRTTSVAAARGGSALSVPGFRHVEAVQDRNCVDCHRATTDSRFLLEQTHRWMNSRQLRVRLSAP